MSTKRKLLILVLIFQWANLKAQYAPQVGLSGCDAISDTSSAIMAWAPYCYLVRGYLNIDSPMLGFTSNGNSSDATGPADRQVVSLGDSGVAILSYPGYIYDAPGADFAVFENGFVDPADDTLAFLELAFVAVSSDGEHYVTFPSRCIISPDVQIRGSGDYMDARSIHNLAGKYIGGYGTPFDLQELSGAPNLDIAHVTHIRITDVVGAIRSHHTSNDGAGNVINDPFPTNFPTGGFDLDAVGLIHYPWHNSVVDLNNADTITISPNPANDLVEINSLPASGSTVYVLSPLGDRKLSFSSKSTTLRLTTGDLLPGVYYIVIQANDGSKCVRSFIKA